MLDVPSMEGLEPTAGGTRSGMLERRVRLTCSLASLKHATEASRVGLSFRPREEVNELLAKWEQAMSPEAQYFFGSEWHLGYR